MIGQQWLLMRNMPRFQPGVVFFKGINKIQTVWMRGVQQLGHRVVAIDEEVTAIANDRFVLKEVHESVFPYVDKIFMQGPFQRRVISDRYPAIVEKLSTTGNARWDLLRPVFRRFHDDDVAAIQRRYGRFILVNTNFGYVNSAWGGPEIFERVCASVGYVTRGDPLDEDWLKSQYEFESRNADAFVPMIAAISDRFPEHQIILRPHPSESLAFWEERLRSIPRAHVVSSGSAVAWILASDYLIHNGCTTGIEAFLLECPVGAYSPFTNWAEDVLLGNKVTTRHASLDTLTADIEAALLDRALFVATSRARNIETLRAHYEGFDGESVTNRIYQEIAPLLQSVESRSLIRRRGDKIDPREDQSVTPEAAEMRARKVDISQAEISKRYLDLMTTLGLRISSQIVPLGPSLFLIEPTR